MTSQTCETYIGCITGTSVDGLDLAALTVEPDGHLQMGPAATVQLPSDLRPRLLELAQPDCDSLDELGHLDRQLGEFIGQSVATFIQQHNLAPAAIGSHGQTVRHRPPPHSHPFTLQIGDANLIAEITGITTVADFRRRDMAVGGQGAPLVPPFHQALFGDTAGTPVILNIGGISNISILGTPPSGFDTGPGNGVMDNWCMLHQQKPYDLDGQWARSGTINEALLSTLLQDPYFKEPAPKSTGREYFNLHWLTPQVPNDIAPADVQATLTELTARCTTNTLEQMHGDYSELIVCGGGRLNGYLLQRLQANTQAKVLTSEQKGVDGDAIEAAAFAWLAYRSLAGLPGNEPAVTGATDLRVLGAIYPAAS